MTKECEDNLNSYNFDFSKMHFGHISYKEFCQIMDRKLTFFGTNACHEVGIEMTMMLKEMGADSLPEAFVISL